MVLRLLASAAKAAESIPLLLRSVRDRRQPGHRGRARRLVVGAVRLRHGGLSRDVRVGLASRHVVEGQLCVADASL